MDYRVMLNNVLDSEGLPITVTISVDKDNQESFERWLEEQEGNEIGHAEGGNVEY